MKTQISLKLDNELLEYLDKRCKEENRSRANLIETMLISDFEIRNELEVSWADRNKIKSV